MVRVVDVIYLFDLQCHVGISTHYYTALSQIIQTFFVSAISGSIASEITNMLEEPGTIVDFLANSLPAQVRPCPSGRSRVLSPHLL